MGPLAIPALTCTIVEALAPLAEAVMMLLPLATALTGTATLLWPTPKGTEAGTVATDVFELVRARVPAAIGIGERAAVNIPVAPTRIFNGFGPSDVGCGFGAPNTLIVTYAPGVLASLTASVFASVRLMVRSMTATFSPKSLGLATCTPLSVIVADEMRWPPLASPFTMCTRTGAPTEVATVTLAADL